MAIDFTQIPENLLVPGQFQEIDNSLAGGSEEVKRALIIGLRSGGTAVAGTVTGVNNGKDADNKFGAGSPVARMAQAYLDVNRTEQLYVLPLAETNAGKKAVQTLSITIQNLKAGLLVRYIDGEKVSVAINAGDSAENIAAGLVAAINAKANMPVVAALVSGNRGKVTLTALSKGEDGNYIVVEGGLAGESDPEGLSISIAQTTNGSGNPDMTAALAKLGGRRYHYLITNLTDQANLGALSTFLDDRYSATKQIGGRLFIALAGEVGDSTSAASMIGQATHLNSPHIVALARGNNHHSPGLFAAHIAARVIRRLSDDPAANTYGVEIPRLLVTSPLDFGNREKLLKAGIATVEASITGTVTVERLVTTYTSDNDGNRDTSYLDIQITETVDAIRTYINSAAVKRFSSWKLSSTSENFGQGAKVMTPGVWKAFLVDLYQNVFIAEKQWCQDFKSYKKSIVANVLAGNKIRLEYQHQPVLIGQFLQSTGLNQFV